MVVSSYAKQRILDLFFELQKTNSQYIYGPISRKLEEEGISVCRKTVRDIIIRYNTTSTLKRKDGSGRPSKATDKQILLKIETYLKTNDEATSSEIKDYLRSFGHSLSFTTIRRAKAFLGWTLKAPGYCQLIRDVNKTKRLAWARANATETFDDVIFTDETSVWLEKHKRRCYHKKGYIKRAKPRAKYPVKVHVWAGISKNGATNACIFEGNMDAQMYTEILDKTLIPFLKSSRTRYRFMQDNDPKHTSMYVQNFLREKNVNWWKTPPVKAGIYLF